LNDIVTAPAHSDDWDIYWQGTKESALPAAGGAQDAALGEFWSGFFRDELPRHAGPRLLDAACGNGAVTGFALAVAGRDIVSTCMDYSRAAVRTLEEKYPGVRGVACDAAATPFADGEFDVVASQFGLEYAGEAAFEEAARLVAKDGVLVAIVHMKKGAIYDECSANLGAIRALRDARLLPLARDAFAAGFAVAAGNAPQSAFREADKNLAPAVETLKETLSKYGPLAAGGLIQRLGQDLAYMYQRIEAYVPQQVLDWLDRMEKETVAYAGRMQSMVDAALDETAIKSLSARLTAKGLTVDTYDVLRMGENQEPAAWILVGRRII
jgi:SAM-dependent methyltransferase